MLKKREEEKHNQNYQKTGNDLIILNISINIYIYIYYINLKKIKNIDKIYSINCLSLRIEIKINKDE